MTKIGRGALLVGLLAAASLAGCTGASSSPASDTGDTQPLAAHPEKAGPNPSKSATLVCSAEAREDLRGSLGLHEAGVTTPTWSDHVYSCVYQYPKGSFTLSVKELTSAHATTTYFHQLIRSQGRRSALHGLGQGSFLTPSGNAVVRKDYKVLLVDVRALPARFVPTLRRSDVAQTIATVIMGCWTGA